MLSSRLLLNVRGVLRNAEAEVSQSHQPSPGGTFGGRHGPPVHIRTVVETVTLRDTDENAKDEALRMGTPESITPVLSRNIQERDGSELERGRWPVVRHQVDAGEPFELRGMIAL